MYFAILLLLAITPRIRTAGYERAHCPYPDNPICDSEGRVYKNWCDYMMAAMLNREIVSMPCDEAPYAPLYLPLLPIDDVSSKLRFNRLQKKRLEDVRNRLNSDVVRQGATTKPNLGARDHDY